MALPRDHIAGDVIFLAYFGHGVERAMERDCLMKGLDGIVPQWAPLVGGGWERRLVT